MENVMNTNGITDARESLIRYLANGQTNQSKVAKEVGVSKTAISLFLKGTYTGNNTELAEKINQFLRMVTARKAVIKKPGICLDVGNTNDILMRVKIAHMQNDILLIYGPAGSGKTTALKHYSQQNNGVIYVEADGTIKNPHGILMLILSTMGEDTKGTTAAMMQRLVRMLTGTNRLIIIDEAQHMTTKAFDVIRALNDKAGVGLVYAGNPDILRRMYGRQEEELDQLYSRIGYKCALKNNYTKAEISGIFKGYNFDEACLDYLLKISKRKGGLRIMVNLCIKAQNFAVSINEEFKTQHMDEVIKKDGIGGNI